MADEHTDEPRKTETTPKGLTVPIPKRREFFASLRKIAKVGDDSPEKHPPTERPSR